MKTAICVYDVDNEGYLKYCRNGGHLQICTTHTCSSTYLKCPDAYCIPWRFVCDGIVDCADRYDEVLCAMYICKGMLRCSNSTYCVHQSEDCDGFSIVQMMMTN